MKKINLPSKYENIFKREEFKKFEGWDKISYSASSSFKEPIYRGDFIKSRFLGIESEQGIFGFFGNLTGSYLDQSDPDFKDEYMETPVVYKGKTIKQTSAEVLRAFKQPENSLYEFEVLIDLEPFGLEKCCMQGFLDRAHFTNNKVDIVDFKTGSIESKEAYYRGPDYTQLDIYAYGLEEMGYEINDNKTKVILFDRKGNSFGGVYPMYLTGEILEIERAYDRANAKKVIENIAKTCVEISDYFAVYNKYFK